MRTLFVILGLGFATPLQAAELRLYPADIPLRDPRAAQPLLVVSEANGQALADSGKGATFSSSNPKVAVVEEGRVRAVGDGEAVVTVKTLDGKEATAKVRVSGAGEVSSPTFRM